MNTDQNLDNELTQLDHDLQNNPAKEIPNEQIEEIAQRLIKTQQESELLKESNDLRTRIANMSVAEKIKAAMFGDVNARALLIKEPNKLVQSFVLKNPQITFEELVGFASDPNTPKGILRVLSETNKWSKEYAMREALVFNPKTPLDISMKWVRYLNMADLKKLSKSKSIPNTLVVIIRKRVTELERRK